MDDYCREFWICSSVPAEWDWFIAIIVSLLFITLVAVPVANILHRAGRSRWWTIIALVPLLNLIGLWAFAFSRWPKLKN